MRPNIILYADEDRWLAYEVGYWSAWVELKILTADCEYNDALKMGAMYLFRFAQRLLDLHQKEAAS